MRITNPRWVEKANQWVVTVINTNEKGKETHAPLWFKTQDEALAYKLEQEAKDEHLT